MAESRIERYVRFLKSAIADLWLLAVVAIVLGDFIFGDWSEGADRYLVGRVLDAIYSFFASGMPDE